MNKFTSNNLTEKQSTIYIWALPELDIKGQGNIVSPAEMTQ